MQKRLVKYVGVAIIIGLVFIAAEIGAYFYTTYLAKNFGILFYTPHITDSYSTYKKRLNPLLGWPSSQAIQEQRQARQAPISAYGDSFTAGYGVPPEDTWSNILGRMLGCTIANYGVPGYGTDQAFLRFQSNPPDGSKIVLFGHLSENIQRNVNQLRNFLVPNQQCQTKPRFVLDDQGKLKLVPVPHVSAADYDKFINNPDLFVKDDYFLPGGPSGAQKLKFPYTLSIIKAYKFFYNRYVLGYKSYLQFYRKDHSSKAFWITIALINKFCAETKKRGKHFIVLIFPTHEDFFYYKKNKKFVYQPLIEEFKKANIAFVDIGYEINKRWGDRNPLELFSKQRYYHFNEEGNKLIAQIVYEYFVAQNLCNRFLTKHLPRRIPWHGLAGRQVGRLNTVSRTRLEEDVRS